MSETETTPAERMPWDLLPTETVCRSRPDGSPGCQLAYHKHLPACPVCQETAR